MAELTARDGDRWLLAGRAADARARALGGARVPLQYAVSDKQTLIDFRGYAYTRKPSEVSDQSMTRYDPGRPQVWRVPRFDEVLPSIEVVAPTGGYIVPVAHAVLLSERLDAHGIVRHRSRDG